jgi:membrane associated rhomboid family serine protease
VLIPLGHENMQGRRWPVISIALVVINIVAFLGTHWQMQSQSPQRAEVRTHILLLAAMHPELSMPEDVQKFVASFRDANPSTWKELSSPNREVVDAWDAAVRLIEDQAPLQREMDSLAQQFAQSQGSSIVERYAFIPAHPTAISYITANFLHGGWLHIIGNMWFLWLAGTILEDTWGRIIYPIFYFTAGAAALQFHAWFNPGSTVATLGASGAVAALMGAFLVRFPKTKIRMAWIFGIRSLSRLAMGDGYKFDAYAYWLLPLWLLMEIFSGAIFGQSSGVAHWAHVGGFAFGAVVALGLRYSGLEQKASQAIEEKVSWTADAAIVQATEDMHAGKLNEAIAALQAYVTAKPNSIEGYTLLQQAQWRKNDIPAYQQTITKLCQLHLKAQEPEAAWQAYEEYIRSGGINLPASTWLELCRIAEGQQDFERAVSEYEKLAQTYPSQREALLALIAAGRLCLKKLARPADALRFYQAACASPVPHLDWEANISAGLEDARKAMGSTGLVEQKP